MVVSPHQFGVDVTWVSLRVEYPASVPFLPDPVRSTYYGPWIASATAIITEAFSLALVAAFLMKRLERSVPARIGVGVLSGLLAPTLFILATAYGVDEIIWVDLGYARPLPDFLYVGGMYWMIGQAIMLPLGYLLGEKREELRSWLFPRAQRKPSLSYASLVTIIVLCAGGGALAFMLGL